MQVHPDIAALRRNRDPQRKAQTAILAANETWAQDPGAAAMRAELEAYGKGAPLDACPTLEAMFTDSGEAERLMDLLCRHYCRAIAANPIGHPPFRQGYDGKSTSILLARTGRAQLLIQAREPGKRTNASYVFSDATRFDAVLAGAADARIVRIAGHEGQQARLVGEGLALRPGHRLALDLNCEAMAIDKIERRLVVLRLLRTAPEPAPGREYDAASGKLLHQSAGRIGTSRREAIIALLGRMGREDAAPQIARIAMEEGDLSLRWQALREALALDTATGFRALARIARRSDDALAAQAGALRAQLLENHPELAHLETGECPA